MVYVKMRVEKGMILDAAWQVGTLYLCLALWRACSGRATDALLHLSSDPTLSGHDRAHAIPNTIGELPLQLSPNRIPIAPRSLSIWNHVDIELPEPASGIRHLRSTASERAIKIIVSSRQYGPCTSIPLRVTAFLALLTASQRHQTLPPAATSSAREALQSFYCSLCAKGYSRMNDYEAHLSSYDHSHKQRLKDMKAMVRDPNAGSRARKAEAKAEGLVSIKLGQGGDAQQQQQQQQSGSAGSGGGFKKGGFKKSGFKSAFAPVDAPDAGAAAADTGASRRESAAPGPQEGSADKDLGALAGDRPALVESDTDDEGYEHYDPRFPTD